MAQLAVAWVLQNQNVASAIIGATKPSQIKENVKAAGVKLEPALMREIDDVLGKIPERSPDKTKSPTARP
jgi:aryl-alcohol dehydrogenase-like predicted oxidoreductase